MEKLTKKELQTEINILKQKLKQNESPQTKRINELLTDIKEKDKIIHDLRYDLKEEINKNRDLDIKYCKVCIELDELKGK